jgi:hypothetical protein
MPSIMVAAGYNRGVGEVAAIAELRDCVEEGYNHGVGELVRRSLFASLRSGTL